MCDVYTDYDDSDDCVNCFDFDDCVDFDDFVDCECEWEFIGQ